MGFVVSKYRLRHRASNVINMVIGFVFLLVVNILSPIGGIVAVIVAVSIVYGCCYCWCYHCYHCHYGFQPDPRRQRSDCLRPGEGVHDTA